MKIKTYISDKLRTIYALLSNYRLLSLKKMYELWEQNHLKRLLPHLDVDCVFDVGANYGQYAQMLRHKANFQGLIISFEPIPDAAVALRVKAAGDPNWIIEECALGSNNGEQSFNIMSDSQFSSLSGPRHDEVDLFHDMNKVSKAVTVKTETLTSAYRRLMALYSFQRPFLKLDSQGLDVDIVTHGKSVIQQFVGLQSELAVKKIYQDSVDYRQALTVYEQCGFSLSAIVPNNEGHFPRLVETDCIMVRTDLLGKTSE